MKIIIRDQNNQDIEYTTDKVQVLIVAETENENEKLSQAKDSRCAVWWAGPKDTDKLAAEKFINRHRQHTLGYK